MNGALLDLIRDSERVAFYIHNGEYWIEWFTNVGSKSYFKHVHDKDFDKAIEKAVNA